MTVYAVVEVLLYLFLTFTLGSINCKDRAPAALALGNTPSCPLNKKFYGPQSQSAYLGEEKNLLSSTALAANF